MKQHRITQQGQCSFQHHPTQLKGGCSRSHRQQRCYSSRIRHQQQMSTHIWCTYLLLSHMLLLPATAATAQHRHQRQQPQQHTATRHLQQQTGSFAAVNILDDMTTWQPTAAAGSLNENSATDSAGLKDSSIPPAAAAAAAGAESTRHSSQWEIHREQLRQRQHQFQQHTYQKQLQLPSIGQQQKQQQQEEGSLTQASNTKPPQVAVLTANAVAAPSLLSAGSVSTGYRSADVTALHSTQRQVVDVTNLSGTGPTRNLHGLMNDLEDDPLIDRSSTSKKAIESKNAHTDAGSSGSSSVIDALGLSGALSSSSSSSTARRIFSAAAADVEEIINGSYAEAVTADTTDQTITAAAAAAATGSGSDATSADSALNAATEAAAVIPSDAESQAGSGTDETPDVAAAATSVQTASNNSSIIHASPGVWRPRVLDAPVPKWPRLYATVAPPAPTLSDVVRPAAVSSLLAAASAAKTPQGISISGIPGLSLEDKILLARLLGHEVRGNFDAAGQLDPSSTAYWEMLDAQIEKHTQVKHMFESIWYKCSKLNADLLMRASSADEMETEALQHILAWLGVPEAKLPRPGEFADFDDLLTLLNGIGAKARLVTDPVPFLATTKAPLDRNGMPMLIHMTFKDKGQFARHHMLSLASWAKENPDHAILMYDDADLESYLSTYNPTVLELYSSLKTAVERSDLWRYVVMCKHGGVYTDADTLGVRPIQEWNSENHNDAAALFGVEDVFQRDPNGGSSSWGVSMGRYGIQFEQWTLAGAPDHPVYCNMHSFISQRIMEESNKESPTATSESENWSILHRTGPHVWTDSVLKWMHDQGIGFHEALVPGGRLVANNTRIMPGETFGCAAHFFSPAARLEEVYAMHMFRGVWRKRLDSGQNEQDRLQLRLGF